MELDLENDLLLSTDDRQYMKTARQGEGGPSPDLSAYLAFLEDIGAFQTRKPPARPFSTDFDLP